MTQDVRHWLTEIKQLQEKLVAFQQERDEAYASAANWRRLYETEAQQRRAEANLAQQTIESLTIELQEIRPVPPVAEDAAQVTTAIQHEVAQLKTVDELRATLAHALMECDRLSHLLKSEQTAHAQTRNSLTAALGDAVEQLKQERGTARSKPDGVRSNAAASPAKPASPKKAEIKTPLLELPPLD